MALKKPLTVIMVYSDAPLMRRQLLQLAGTILIPPVVAAVAAKLPAAVSWTLTTT